MDKLLQRLFLVFHASQVDSTKFESKGILSITLPFFDSGGKLTFGLGKRQSIIPGMNDVLLDKSSKMP